MCYPSSSVHPNVWPGYHRPPQLTAEPHITNKLQNTKPLEQMTAQLKLLCNVVFLRPMNAVYS